MAVVLVLFSLLSSRLTTSNDWILGCVASAMSSLSRRCSALRCSSVDSVVVGRFFRQIRRLWFRFLPFPLDVDIFVFFLRCFLLLHRPPSFRISSAISALFAFCVSIRVVDFSVWFFVSCVVTSVFAFVVVHRLRRWDRASTSWCLVVLFRRCVS
jgi:hypothetical protein